MKSCCPSGAGRTTMFGGRCSDGNSFHEAVLDRRERGVRCVVCVDVDDVVAVGARDQRRGRRRLESRDVAEIDDAAARRANGNAFERLDARLIRLRVDHLDLLEARRRLELRRKIAAERRAGGLRGLAEVDAERLRLVAIELNRDLGRELRTAAVDARRALDRAAAAPPPFARMGSGRRRSRR